jgi:hypothetical protein
VSYDAQQDSFIEALRTVGKDAVNAALLGVLGAGYPAVQDTVGYAMPIDLADQKMFPLLAVYVERENSEYFRMARKTARRATVVFEYFAKTTPLKKLDVRWPLLRLVWGALIDAMRTNFVSDLQPVGVLEIDDQKASVQYDFATDGESAYPHFRARIEFVIQPGSDPFDTSDLSPVSLDAKISRDDGNEDLQPQVEFIETTT